MVGLSWVGIGATLPKQATSPACLIRTLNADHGVVFWLKSD